MTILQRESLRVTGCRRFGSSRIFFFESAQSAESEVEGFGAGVEKLDVGPKGAMISFHNNHFNHVDQLMAWVMKQAGTVKIRPDQKLIYARAWEQADKRLKGARGLVQELALLAA